MKTMAMYKTAMPVHTSNGRNVSLTSFWPVPRDPLEDADDADEAGVLDHPDESLPAAGSRLGRLGQDDRAEHAGWADPARQGGLALARRDRRERGAEDLRHERPVEDRERDHARLEVRELEPTPSETPK